LRRVRDVSDDRSVRRLKLLLPMAAVAALLVAAPVLAAAPRNDSRESPQQLTSLPSDVGGTTLGATRVDDDPASSCGNTSGSVWYRLDVRQASRFVVDLQANGDLDATLDVFQRERSQLTPVECDNTDRKGRGSVTFRAKEGESYLIRVAERSGSAAGTFHLTVFTPLPSARFPGARLPKRGVTRTLDRVQNTEDAFRVQLREGVTYRINEADTIDGCMRVELFGPHRSSFDNPDVEGGCGGYTLFTPRAGDGGRWSIRVLASSSFRGAQRYHLQVARAGPDDTAPGRFISNFARVHGGLRGSGIDVVDLYRFDVTRRSATFISLDTSSSNTFDVILTNDGGRRLACGCGDEGGTELHRGLRPGRYFIAVRARPGSRGKYTLRRASRTITTASITFNGQRRATIAPGGSAQLSIDVSPPVAGPKVFDVERFDPIDGWQFFRRFHTSGGAVSFHPPSIGKYRARGVYKGTRENAPANTGFAYLTVEGPLRD
jgi:hypothetical protein